MAGKQQRLYLMKKYSALYKRAMWFDMDKCVYCGAGRQCLDHVPAISLLENIDVKRYLKQGGTLTLYPCCSKCNSLLGNTEALSLYDRLQALLKKYNKRLDRIEVWEDSELKEMGKNMRSYIQSQQFKLKELNDAVYNIDIKILQIETGKMDDDGMLLE